MHWISVKDRLPDVDIEVFVYGFIVKDKPIFGVGCIGHKLDYIGVICPHEFDECGECGTSACCCPTAMTVTHWMPLPKGPNALD